MKAGDRLNEEQATQDAKMADLKAELTDIAARLTALEQKVGPPPDPEPGPGPDPPPQPSPARLGINVGFEHKTSAIAPDPSTPTGYRVTVPSAVKLYGQFDPIRTMNWTNQVSSRRRNERWDNRITQDDFHPNERKRWPDGVPIEGQIAFCNACDSNMYWNFPQQCDADFMRRAGDLFTQHYQGDTLYLEGPNEASWDKARGWHYSRDGAGWEKQLDRYAEDCEVKFAAFAETFDPARTFRIIGGALHNRGIIKNIVDRIDIDSFDAITCSGYFGNSHHKGEHWQNGKHGLSESIGELEWHAQYAGLINKDWGVYELNQHIQDDIDVALSDDVTDGVGAMIRRAKDLNALFICLYRGVDDIYDRYPWALYDLDYRPRPHAARLGLPDTENT